MRIPLALIVALVVLAEIATFILVGRVLGVAGTLALTVLGFLAGLVLLRQQGVATIQRVRTEFAARRPPTAALADGAAIAVAAVLIIIPGFLTDLVAFMLLIPPVRQAIWRRLAGKLRAARDFRPVRPASPGVLELDRRDYSAMPTAASPWNRTPRRGDESAL